MSAGLDTISAVQIILIMHIFTFFALITLKIFLLIFINIPRNMSYYDIGNIPVKRVLGNFLEKSDKKSSKDVFRLIQALNSKLFF